ncbi:hypothetical protein K4F52_005172 [Lecanicillium sp. MT-2017a]|nr:hypothetical protein K4F52_005172 [Lecanicillium sp. MT-2017a]
MSTAKALKGITLEELTSLPPRNYRIQTPHLIIRNLQDGDADGYYAMLSDRRNFTHDPIDTTLTQDEIPQRIQKLNSMASLGANGYVGFENRVSGKLVGHGGYNTFQMVDIREFFGAPDLPGMQKVMTDIGIMIDHRHWRKGYAREAFCALVEYSIQNLGCEVFRCESAQDNVPWHRLMDSVGMTAAVTDSLASYTANLRVSAWKWDVNFWYSAKSWMQDCGTWPLMIDDRPAPDLPAPLAEPPARYRKATY